MTTSDPWQQRWDGTTHRLEVWYATLTAPSGTGLWIHGETVAPTDGPVERHGWAALFPTDGPPRWERSGRSPGGLGDGASRFECDGLQLGPDGSHGGRGGLDWDLTWDSSDQRTLYTFPRWAWQRELLPGAQVVPAPTLSDVGGTVELDGETYDFDGATGGVARIYGHGNAERWGWLHADLGGGDVLELVSGVATRPGLRRLPPITHLRLRVDSTDWPTLQAPSLRLRTRLGRPRWQVSGRVGRAEVHIDVHQPDDRCVAVGYTDPDGRTATCTNTERADVSIRITGAPFGDRQWDLDGTAHAEIGERPGPAPSD